MELTGEGQRELMERRLLSREDLSLLMKEEKKGVLPGCDAKGYCCVAKGCERFGLRLLMGRRRGGAGGEEGALNIFSWWEVGGRVRKAWGKARDSLREMRREVSRRQWRVRAACKSVNDGRASQELHETQLLRTS